MRRSEVKTMFVFSVKADRTKIIAAACAALLVTVGILLTVRSTGKPVANDGDISYKASNPQERIAFLSQFGWKTDEDPLEVAEVIIPSEFDTTYTAYNELQKEQGLDLEPYKGVRAQRWVYSIGNYPGHTDSGSDIRATLLILDGIVIGGDISSMEQGGFTAGFEFPSTDPPEQTSVS